MKQRRYDLHMHTQRSDGRHDLMEVLARCARGGLDVIAVTDHDALTNLEPGTRDVEGRALTLLAAAEVTVRLEDREHHVLVYFNGPAPAAFQTFCAAQCAARAVRYETGRNRIGVEEIPSAVALIDAGVIAPTRHHLARSLVRLGHAKDVGSAFRQFLGKGMVPLLETGLDETLQLVRAHGGVAVWAHPSIQDANKLLDRFVRAGIHGIEALRPRLTSRERSTLRRMATKAGLFVTGGSDWHGWGDPDLGLFSVTEGDISGFVDALAAA